jgi:hypothetical protein
MKIVRCTNDAALWDVKEKYQMMIEYQSRFSYL